jgi:hypothetical protein
MMKNGVMDAWSNVTGVTGYLECLPIVKYRMRKMNTTNATR